MNGAPVAALLARLGWQAAWDSNRAVLAEATEHGLATMTAGELRTLAERVAGRGRDLSPTAVTVLDGSPASIAVLLGLLAAGVEVLAVEAGNSHLSDSRSAIWSAGAKVIIRPDSGALRAAGSIADVTYGDLLAPGTRCGNASAGALKRASHPARVLLLTSGSTGEPRLVRQPLSALVRGGELYRQIHGYNRSDQIVLPIPVAHSFGLVGGVLAGLGAGAQLVTMPRFSLSGLLRTLASGASVLLGSPLLYTMLVQAWGAAAAAPRLRVLLCSGGPLAQETEAAVRELCGLSVRQAYGSTETGLIACQDGSRSAWHPESVGVFAPGVQWRLLTDSTDGNVDAWPSGQLLAVRTSTMFTGYADGGPALRPDGFYETGDLVQVAESGEVFLSGRKATFINVGGKKANPRRIERLIMDHPDVAEVYVFGMAAHHEQAVHAAVMPRPRGGRALPGEITALCRERLSAYEVPHEIHILPRLPRTSLGKIDHSAVLAAIAEKENQRHD